MAAITLSRAEYLVILDILHADHIFGLETHTLIPADRAEHLELIHQGIRQLEAKGLVRIERGKHIIERRLLEVVSVVAQPKVVITTILDQAGIGGQLYLHYQIQGDIVEQVLPDENHYTLAQLPDITSVMDRILRILDLPNRSHDFPDPQAIARDHLYQVYQQIETGDRPGALMSLISAGWPDPFARDYLATQANQQMAGLVNLMAPDGGTPGESRDLTVIHDNEIAWLVTARPYERNHLQVRQVNAASFRMMLEEAYSAVIGQIQG